MLVGDAKYVLASTSSLDRNLNGCGYCKSAACGGDCTVDSPVTDAQLHAQRRRAQLGLPRRLRGVDRRRRVRGQGLRRRQHHLRPRVAVEGEHQHRHRDAQACCGGCPAGTNRVETPLGSKCCPPGTSEGPTCGCPAGTTKIETSLGSTCCPEGSHPVEGSEGATCVPGCPAGTRPVEGPLGTTCTACPEGTRPVEGPLGTTCEPVPARVGAREPGLSVDGERMRAARAPRRWVVVVEERRGGRGRPRRRAGEGIPGPRSGDRGARRHSCSRLPRWRRRVPRQWRRQAAMRSPIDWSHVARPVSSRSRCAACRARSRRSRTPGRRWCSGTWRGRSSSS